MIQKNSSPSAPHASPLEHGVKNFAGDLAQAQCATIGHRQIQHLMNNNLLHGATYFTYYTGQPDPET